MISKTKHNDQEEQQELVVEEDYLGDSQYKQERFTDTYSEYFEDEQNKADRYSNGLLLFNEVKPLSAKEPITAIAKKNPIFRKVTEEIKVYTEEDHINSVDEEVKEIYSELKSAILSLGTNLLFIII